MYKDIPFELDGKIITSNEYINKIKDNKFWMGDIEIVAVNTIYDATLFLFELSSNNELTLL